MRAVSYSASQRTVLARPMSFDAVPGRPETLAAEGGLSVGYREPALVQRAADDHPRQAPEREVAERMQIVERADAAGVDEARMGLLGGPREIRQFLDRRPAQRAVHLNRSEHERPNAACREVGKCLRRRRGGVALPSLDGHMPAARIETDDDSLAMVLRERGHETGLGQRRGPEHDAICARLQGRRDRAGVPQSAADLDRHLGLRGDPAHLLQVPRFTFARTVQIDDVKRSRSLLQPAACGVERVVVVGRLTPVVALKQPDGVTIPDVDRRIEDHAGTDAQISAKLARTRSPAELDFSGWNCTPYSGGRATAHTKRSPHSAIPNTSSCSPGLTANECTK